MNIYTNKKWLENWALISFIGITILFILFNLSISFLEIPSPIGGGASFISVFSLSIYFIYLIFRSIFKTIDIKINERHLLLFLLFGLWLFITFIAYINEKPNIHFSSEMFYWSINGFLLALNYFLIAYHINLHNQILFTLSSLFLLLLFFILLTNINEYYIFSIKENDNSIGYQQFARIILLIGLFLTAYFKYNNWHSLFLHMIIFVLFFINGARTELILYIFAIIMFYIIKFRFSIYTVIKICLIGIFTFIIFINIDNMLYEFSKSRMFGLLDPLSTTSGIERLMLIESAIEVISNNVIFGEYGSYVKFGTIGYYPHNILSIWYNFGIFGFILFFIILYIITKDLLFFFRKNDINSYFFILIYFAMIPALLFSKDYSYQPVYFLFGIWLNNFEKIQC